MTKVRIIAEGGETIDEAEEKLYKAMRSHRTGDSHSEDFSDPAMRDLLIKMENEHEEMYADMMREIFEVLDEEYSNGYF